MAAYSGDAAISVFTDLRGGEKNMRFYETESLERIGFDFYCDTAEMIARVRQRKGWTQAELAKESGIQLSRLVKIENVKIRIYLTDLEKLSKSLDVTVDHLVEANPDSQVGECLYLIWPESMPRFKLYQKATSKRMAFLEYDKKFKEKNIAYSSPRERFFVKLVGIPITDSEIKNKFSKLTSDEETIEP